MIAAGLWALPGLVDGHAHLAQATMDLAPGSRRCGRAGDGAPCRCGVDPRQGWRDLTVVHLIDEVPASGAPRSRQPAGPAGRPWFLEGLPRRGSGRRGGAAVQPKREQAGSSWSVTGRGKAWVRSQTSMRRRWGRPWRRREEHEAPSALHTMARGPSAVRAGVDSIDMGCSVRP